MTFTTLATTLALALLSCLPSCVLADPRTVTASAKAGLAWPNGPADDMSQYEASKVSWYYTWSPSPVEDDTLEFVPMLWGQTQAQQFGATINDTIASKDVRAALAMNEPNQQGQSDMAPADAVQLWQTYLQPLHARGISLGSPAPTSAPNGKTWLQEFIGDCTGCTIDFIALHWYGTNATQFVAYMEDMHSTFNRPLWVTEWACQDYNGGPQCSAAQVQSFLSATQGFMDTTPWIERYSWFGVMENLQGVNQLNALMDKNGKITPLGQQYIGVAGNASGSGPAPGKSAAARPRPAGGLAVWPWLVSVTMLFLVGIV